VLPSQRTVRAGPEIPPVHATPRPHSSGAEAPCREEALLQADEEGTDAAPGGVRGS
jgi:hypothetical protein